MEPKPLKTKKSALKYGVSEEQARVMLEFKKLLIQAKSSSPEVSAQILHILSTETETPLFKIIAGSYFEILEIPPTQNVDLLKELFQRLDFNKESEQLPNFHGAFKKAKADLSIQELIEELTVYLQILPREPMIQSLLRMVRHKATGHEVSNFPATYYYIHQLYKFIFDYLTEEEKQLFYTELEFFSIRFETHRKVERTIDHEDSDLEFLNSISPETNQLYQRIKYLYSKHQLQPDDYEAVYTLLEYIPQSKLLQEIIRNLILNNTEIVKHLSESHPLDWQVICEDYSQKGFNKVPIIKHEILDPEDFLELCSLDHALDSFDIFNETQLQALIAKYPYSQAVKFIQVKFFLRNKEFAPAKKLARSCSLLAQNTHVIRLLNSSTN